MLPTEALGLPAHAWRKTANTERWFHGKTNRDPGGFQRDPQHPGIWLADGLKAATWYAGQQGEVQLIEVRETQILDLDDRETFDQLMQRAGLTPRANEVKKAHRSGQLYLIDSGQLQNALVAAAFETHHGLITRDWTGQTRHRSLIVCRGKHLICLGRKVVNGAS